MCKRDDGCTGHKNTAAQLTTGRPLEQREKETRDQGHIEKGKGKSEWHDMMSR